MHLLTVASLNEYLYCLMVHSFASSLVKKLEDKLKIKHDKNVVYKYPATGLESSHAFPY